MSDAAIDRFIEEIEGESNRKVTEALAKVRKVVQDRHRNMKEHTMEKTNDLKAGMPSTSTAPASPAVTAKTVAKKAVAKAKPKPKAVSKPKPKAKAAPKKKVKKVKTNSKAMGRARVYTKELIMGLVKQVKAARAKGLNMSLKKLVAKNKKLRYVPLLVASRHPSINLNLGELLGTWHRQGKKVSRKSK